ncbi:F-type H+-transporting ATPase subunit b [Oceanisphaera litoralis]|jgi:F-type H+-transporting ATPase subunit b|uniref:ATP synthase subunit b n=1 Tax=Oceanisphaera arctica TaxID=641510 RepID=A0A2P5TPA5_9GAMM|nr:MULTISPECIES: F0F1 ATP synthase subunit B [Oceanisphaera]MBM7456060.1 F-type H+-transporting ATPase subunit b [Oceanisphaera litoralis]MBR9856905.1 F0F1 ATP synthase subunit B [Gammaproteobacteria bacterium]PPL17515.1 F0F1 ATP synthase subunit B [Oceanisphaera arctica]GHA16619.1 ATP synthase subunit b [Oceanisphaera arctica]
MNMNATILGQTIAFILFVWFCMKFVWPPLMAAIENRQKEIAEGLSSAERAKKDLALAQNNATEQLKEAKLQSAQIVELANKRKAQIVEDATREAQAEREKILAQAQAEVEAERNRVKEELRKQVAALALVGAEKILERQIDAAANSDIVEKVVAEL